MHPNKIENLNIIYDFKGPFGEIPNCLNYYYSETISKNRFKIDSDIQDYFFKNFLQLSVTNVYMNSDMRLQNRITIREYETNKRKYKKDANFYLVEPFGSFNHFLGKQFGGFSETNFIDFISKKSLDNIKNDNSFYLLINYSTEGVFPVDCFSNLYSVLESNNIPLNKVILLCAAADIDNLHKKVRNHNPNKIHTIYYPWSLRHKSKEMKEIYEGEDYKFWDDIEQKNTIVNEEDLNKNVLRKNKFILMNRRLRPHRWVLLCLLGESFIKENLVSFDSDLFDRENQMDFFDWHVSEKNKQDAFNSSKDLYRIKKSVIDYEDINSIWGFNFENKEPYLDSYIHICSETNFYEDGLYFSEKTWKPMAHLQPFIHVNKSGGLRELKKLGFKTFHPFINEDYDNEEDDRKRMDMIYDEINRINKLSIEEIHEWYYSIYDILIYNRDLLFSFADKKEQTEVEFLNNLKYHVVDKENKKLLS
jgi:hypothetical protein